MAWRSKDVLRVIIRALGIPGFLPITWFFPWFFHGVSMALGIFGTAPSRTSAHPPSSASPWALPGAPFGSASSTADLGAKWDGRGPIWPIS